MIDQIKISNFGPLAKLDWHSLGPINLVIGRNGSGKTFFLKACYSAIRTLEEYKRGKDNRTAPEILAEKLYWTFQPDKIGDLVGKSISGPLSCSIIAQEGNHFTYSFGKDTSKQISSLTNTFPSRSSNSIFLPAKEILSLHQIILESRERDKAFGFDDTYLDLARALRQSTTRGNNYKEFAQSRQHLETILGGRVEFDEISNQWLFKKGKQKFPIGVTAEGIKKIAILDTLLGNRYLDTGSIIFIDEPESALHPEGISQLLQIISVLAQRGIQFFLASHSYFVVKKLFLIAQKSNISISVLSEYENQWKLDNLKNGMPENAIINESVRLYKEEVELAFR
ncbi:MAG: ATP-binding protein [Candidatus Electrothrix sp. MAN1_4]|nr:ATP-binding protein [Candidatus Electrothrix sp. MAN1_4]